MVLAGPQEKMKYVRVYCLRKVLCSAMKYGTKLNLIIGVYFLLLLGEKYLNCKLLYAKYLI